jgi:hypothetical protein
MKRIVSVLFLISLFAACKYEDGPNLSLRTKKQRAVNIWHLDKVLENGLDRTEDYKNAFVNYEISINKDNTYVLKYRPFNLSDYSESGTWSFSGDKVFINFSPKDGSSVNPWKMLRLTETETWVIQTIDGKELELRMKD